MDPLLNAQGRASSRRHVTVRDGKAGLPYSKGLMAQPVMAAASPHAVREMLHASSFEVTALPKDPPDDPESSVMGWTPPSHEQWGSSHRLRLMPPTPNVRASPRQTHLII